MAGGVRLRLMPANFQNRNVSCLLLARNIDKLKIAESENTFPRRIYDSCTWRSFFSPVKLGSI